ncbi:hypothetical protein Leryth_016912 [Lithospermum erythrorhizon]|nr:hypothetical protein Leryth_016912 [Lithospermum erythrorhizon]
MGFEDSLEELHGPFNKRLRTSIQHKQSSLGSWVEYEETPVQHNPLNDQRPLGLHLRKSPSLLELIQMRLSEENPSQKAGGHGTRDHKGTSGSRITDKRKASNFQASSLKIGSWEYKSRYEGDLVAKCYFAKHKVVWEVLDGGLKNKIEIQWSDIMSIKAKYADDGPETLDVVLAKQPVFYRETNPQPRKHTLWQVTSDFTNEQASIHRCHRLLCPQGSLRRHFEKLIQCDPRLNFLSRQPEITLGSPYFEPRLPVFGDPSEPTSSFELNSERSPSPFNLRDVVRRRPESVPGETLPPIMDANATKNTRTMADRHGKEVPRNTCPWNNASIPWITTSTSMTDLVSHLEKRICEQRTSNNFSLSDEEWKSLAALEDISRSLFSIAQNMPTSDEKSLMSRVNSLCCLLQKDPSTVPNVPSSDNNLVGMPTTSKGALQSNSAQICETSSKESDEFPGCKQTLPIAREDSYGDLLLNLPRIASLPQFLYNLGDGNNDQAQ